MKTCICCGRSEETVEILFDSDLGDVCTDCIKASRDRIETKNSTEKPSH